jgi:hypothetical protein
MSKDQADQSGTAAGAGPSEAAPLLRTLGDANAAVCTDGFCEVPQSQAVPQRQAAPPEAGQEAAPGQSTTIGVAE